MLGTLPCSDLMLRPIVQVEQLSRDVHRQQGVTISMAHNKGCVHRCLHALFHVFRVKSSSGCYITSKAPFCLLSGQENVQAGLLQDMSQTVKALFVQEWYSTAVHSRRRRRSLRLSEDIQRVAALRPHVCHKVVALTEHVFSHSRQATYSYLTYKLHKVHTVELHCPSSASVLAGHTCLVLRKPPISTSCSAFCT